MVLFCPEVIDVIDKSIFGAFIREKRLEHGLTQRELAERLSVSESAVSKWEMAKSYPDITMIPDICRVLDVSEHELIAGAVDTEYRRLRREAHLYRRISETYFWGFTVAYALALLICLICDLALHRRLGFSLIVFAALLVAFSFIPSWIRFTERHKLALFVGSSYLSLVFLFFICCLRFRQNWFGIASLAVLLGYALVFSPALFRRYLPEKSRRFFPLVYFSLLFLLLILLLSVIRITVVYPLGAAIGMSLYAWLPFLILSLVHLGRLSPLARASLDTLVFGFDLYGVNAVASRLFGGATPGFYRVDLGDWASCTNGNISFLLLLCSLVAAAGLLTAAIVQKRKN